MTLRKLRLFGLETVRAQSRKQLDSMKKAVCTRSVTIRLNRLIEQYLIVATGNKHDSSRTYELKKLVAAWHGHAK